MYDMGNYESTAINFIRDYTEFSMHLPDGPISKKAPQYKLEKILQQGIPAKGRPLDDVVEELCRDIMPYGNHNNHPRFFGFIPSTASPISWLGDIITTAYNRHAGSADNQPAIWCVEQELIRWLNNRVGFPEKAGGIFVSGGSMANLTAMTIARDNLLEESDWSRGTAYLSDQTHSSVEKGLKVIGIGSSRIRKIPTDDLFRMDTQALRRAVKEDVENGFMPFLTIATAGTTNTGSVDPLSKIRDICNEYGMWMHVDGAFGASVVLSENYSDMLAGIETADSLSWDAHKWLFQTVGCSMVLVRDQKYMLNSFSVHPEYLKDLEKDGSSINPWDLGIELTRPARCIKLWLTLQVMGCHAISENIEHGIRLAECAEKKLRENSTIEIVSPAQFGIVNFRYAPVGMSERQRNMLNSKISEKILKDGYAGVFTTELNGKKVLRMCIIHPETTLDELKETIELIDRCFTESLEEVGGLWRKIS